MATRRIYVPSDGPESWRGFLADPEKQWKAGYSARMLAERWESGPGTLPPEIDALLASHGDFANGPRELLIALPEHKVALPGGGRETQTDVFALVGLADGTLSLAVEGKVNESFGPMIGDWLVDASQGKRTRLAYLCGLLGCASPPAHTRYQLLHRAAAAVIEAARFRSVSAAMIVHSFSAEARWFEDFAAFSRLLGAEIGPAGIARTMLPSGLPLYLGWAKGG
jgi:Domain of unknown function (DUF6946)